MGESGQAATGHGLEASGREEAVMERFEGEVGEDDAVMRVALEYTEATEGGEDLQAAGRGLTLVFAHLTGADVSVEEPSDASLHER
jgi:hypothetical protein